MTILAKLVASANEASGYIIYVFECLEDDVSIRTRYVMCSRPPNWDHRSIEIGEIGYLQYKKAYAGIDKWFDGQTMVPYRYDGIYFLKFVEKPKEKSHKFTVQINFK